MSTLNKLFPCFLFCWMVVSLTFKATGQIPGMRKYTQLDGFSATNGYEFEQDKRGYLWIGTDNGGMSFDGKKFKVLLEKRRFRDAEILSIIPLSDDRIILVPIAHNVCYLQNGVLVTDAEDSRLRNIYNINHNISKPDRVTGKYWLIDASWLGTAYCFKGKEIKQYPIGNERFFISVIINNQFIGSLVDAQERSFPCIYDLKTGTYHYLYSAPGTRMLSSEVIIYTGTCSSPDYLFGYNHKTNRINIYRYTTGDTVLQRINQIQLHDNTNHCYPVITVDRNDQLWLKYLGKNGIWYYGSIHEKQNQQKVFHFAEPRMINSFFIDQNSNLWISSRTNALYFISKKHIGNTLLTSRFPLKKEVPKSISGNSKGQLLISYMNSQDLACVWGTNHKTAKLNSNFSEGCRNILPLKNNRFLIWDGAVAVYDMNAHTLHYINKSEIPCKDVCLYGEQDLLIAETNHVRHITSFLSKQPKLTYIFYGRATAVEVLRNGTILVGTPMGLYTKRNLADSAMKINDSLLGSGNITDIQALPNGGALVGTNGLGLFLYHADGSVKPVEEKRLNHIRSLYKQNDSIYWAATNDGVYSFIFNSNWYVKEVKNYTFYDGLPSNSATSVFVCRDTAYVATSEGLGIIPLKDSALLRMDPPEIYLNTIQTDKTTFRYPDTSLTLSSDQNNILASLSAISYESLGNVQYFYRLYPLQSKWVQTTEPDIRFTELPPGEYVLQAYALNAKGVRSLKTVVLRIFVKPAFWQTFYFKAAWLVLGGILLYLGLRWWIQRREKKKFEKVQQKKRLAELELEAIKAQINPHFIYNCLNSIQYLNYKAEHLQAQQYLDLFARLIRMTMQYSQQAFISIEEEEDYLSNYLQLEKLRFKDRLHYDIHVENGLNKEMLLPAMLIQPHVENALKHGIAGQEKGEVRIWFREREGKFQIVVQDNGPGFSDLKRPGALGLRLSGTRAASYNELFGLNIRIHYYNQQDFKPDTTGAAVKIEMDLPGAIQSKK